MSDTTFSDSYTPLDKAFLLVGEFLTVFAKYEASIYQAYSSYIGLDDPIVRALVSDRRWSEVLGTLKRLMVAKGANNEAMKTLEDISRYDKKLRPFRDLCAHYPVVASGPDEYGRYFIMFEGGINPTNKNPEPWEQFSFSEFRACQSAALWLTTEVWYRLGPALRGREEPQDALTIAHGSWPQLPELRRSSR